MSDITPELNTIDISIRANLIKDITTQLVEFKIQNRIRETLWLS